MGWYGIPEVKNIRELKNYLTDSSRIGEGFTILDTAIKKDHIWVLYKNPSNIITAECDLVSNEGREIMYKPIGIEMCPFQYDIPPKWLQQLTPVNEREKLCNEKLNFLREWFEGVSDFHNKEMEVEVE